jgi:hypothetical protein
MGDLLCKKKTVLSDLRIPPGVKTLAGTENGLKPVKAIPKQVLPCLV